MGNKQPSAMGNVLWIITNLVTDNSSMVENCCNSSYIWKERRQI